MKKVVLIIVLCAFAVTPAMADFSGGQVYWERLGGYYSGNGGEFTFRSDGGPGLLLSIGAYDATTSGLGTWGESFQTFCLEGGEYVYSGQSLEIEVSTTFIDETTGELLTGTGSHAILGSKAYGDNLDARTAYLYTKFATGTLTGYDYTLAGRATSAYDLQRAIWYIEGEANGANNYFVELAVKAISDGGEWVGMGIGNVRVLNTWVPGGHVGDLNYARQDMLYLVPVPTAVILGLLGLGVAGIKLRKYT